MPSDSREQPRSGRRPSWLSEGSEPDYRFSLANERTFLAWIRTSLAFLAAAVAMVQLVPAFRVHAAQTAVGLLLVLAGLMSSSFAYLRWAGNERAMRTGRALPHTWLLLALDIALIVVGLGVLLLVLTARR